MSARMADQRVETLLLDLDMAKDATELLTGEMKRARGEEVRLRKLVGSLRREIDDVHKNGRLLPDYACAECDPQGDILIAGFRCAYHEAKAMEGGDGV